MTLSFCENATKISKSFTHNTFIQSIYNYSDIFMSHRT